MRQIQNRDNQACNSNDNHKLFVCTHKHPLLCKTQGEECSRPTGCRGKYIICASAILRAGGAGEGHSLCWKAAIGERKIAFGSVYSHLLSSFIRSISCCRPSGVISTSMRSCAAILPVDQARCWCLPDPEQMKYHPEKVLYWLFLFGILVF